MGQKHWPHNIQLQKLYEYRNLRQETELSEQAAADQVGVPRTTLRHWDTQCNATLIPESIVDALQTKDGLQFLHVIITAVQFLVTQMRKTGIRIVEKFLDMTEISLMVSSAYGTLQAQGVAMETHINDFGRAEIERLSENMPHKNITLGKDETLNGGLSYLVGMEPVSNYIITESSSDTRTATDWDATLRKQLSSYNVTVIQNVNDEGVAIKKYNAQHHPDANESPDLFHILNRINQSVAGAIGSKRRSHEKQLATITQKQDANKAKIAAVKASSAKEKHKKDKLSKLALEQKLLNKEREVAQTKLSTVNNWDLRIGVARKQISQAYHPYDLTTGSLHTVEEVSAELSIAFNSIKAVAQEMSLSDKAIRRIDSAAEMITLMLTTLRFFFNKTDNMIKNATLTNDAEELLRQTLMPITYLKIASGKAQRANEKHDIMAVALKCEKSLNDNTIWGKLSDTEKSALQTLAKECVEIFQRSSSCLEGRNGHLTLWHHGLGMVEPRKLSALTVVHNFFPTRDDNTTAAERFFEQAHNNLFRDLVEKMPLPLRSRKTQLSPQEGFLMAMMTRDTLSRSVIRFVFVLEKIIKSPSQ